jgi:hypothetical protein
MSPFNSIDRQWMIPCGAYARLRCVHLARPNFSQLPTATDRRRLRFHFRPRMRHGHEKES